MPPKTDWQEVRFATCAEALGIKLEEAHRRYEDLRRCYGGHDRYYHTWEHITDSLSLLDLVEIEGLVQEPYQLEWAIYYHDSIYSTEFSEQNEDLSACKACFRLPVVYQDYVIKLILYTEPGMPRATLRDGELMQDIDLAIFGVDEDDYGIYADRIRMEYIRVPAEKFNAGRIRILEGILEKNGPFYNTEFFRDRYEAQAKVNLRREIDKLKGGK